MTAALAKQGPLPTCLSRLCSEPNLLVRACNQLGQFLQHRETNLRYLALESMCTLASSEFSHEAVKTHIDTVINALKVQPLGACPGHTDLAYGSSAPSEGLGDPEALGDQPREPRAHPTCSASLDGAGRQCAAAGG